MKKFILIAMVMCIAIPALADVAITTVAGENSLEISYAATGGAAVRGIALKVTVLSSAGVTIVSVDGDAATNFNVFMDSAFEDVQGGSYTIGTGTALANAAAAGAYAGSLDVASLCVGHVDISGSQGAAADTGIVETVIFDIPEGENRMVRVEVDTLRGGVVGDTIGTVTPPADTQVDGPPAPACKGDGNDSGVVDLADLSVMVTLLGDNWHDQWTDSCLNSGYCDYYLGSGDAGFNAAFDFNDNDTIDLADLSAMVTLLGDNWHDQWTDSCMNSGYCDYYYTCP